MKRNSKAIQINLLGESFCLPEPRCDDCAPGDIPLEHGLTPDPAFVDTVRRFGVIEPVVALSCASTVLLVSGRRRVRAAMACGLSHIPCVVYAIPNVQLPLLPLIASLLTVLLNEQRRENPLADVAAIGRLRSQGATDRDITAVTGMPAGRIRRREKLTRLIPPLLEALERAAIGVGLAEHMAVLPVTQQETLADKLRMGHTLTRRDLAEAKSARAHAQALALLSEADFSDLVSAPTPATLTEIAQAISPLTAGRVADELPGDLRFAAARRIFQGRAEASAPDALVREQFFKLVRATSPVSA